MIVTSAPVGPTPATDPSGQTQQMRELAKEFEAVFLAEMLKHSGLNKTSSEFGGGVGEDAFGSLLTTEYARALATQGGVGIAEHVFRAFTQMDLTTESNP